MIHADWRWERAARTLWFWKLASMGNTEFAAAALRYFCQEIELKFPRLGQPVPGFLAFMSGGTSFSAACTQWMRCLGRGRDHQTGPAAALELFEILPVRLRCRRGRFWRRIARSHQPIACKLRALRAMHERGGGRRSHHRYANQLGWTAATSGTCSTDLAAMASPRKDLVDNLLTFVR